MVDQSELFTKIKGGWDIASKLAGKGMGEVSGFLSKGDESKNAQQSGVYWNRGSWSSSGGFIPEIEFFELQSLTQGFAAGVMQRLTMSKGERLFMQACQNLIGVNSEQAVSLLREAVSADTQFTDAYVMLGCMLLEMDSAQEASSYFQKALLCQQGLGQKFKKYLPSFRMTIALTPWSSIAVYPDLLGVNILLALAWRKSGNLQMAASVMEQIMSIMPEAPLAQFFMGILRLEQRQFNEIAVMFANLEPVSTIHAVNLLILGRACQETGFAQTLMESFDRAVSCTDIDKVVRYDLLYMQNRLRGIAAGQAEAAIIKECPEYQPIFERLGINVPSASELSASVSAQNAQVQQSAAQISADSVQPVLNEPAVQATSAAASADKKVCASCGAVNSPTSKFCDECGSKMAAPAVQQAVYSQNSAAAEGNNFGMPPMTAQNSAPVQTAALPVPPFTPAENKAAEASVSAAEDLFSDLKLKSLSGQIFALDKLVTAIGREAGDILLTGDSSVSYSHARIVREGRSSFIEDLHSTNGVYVNEQRLTAGVRRRLQRGDAVKIGNTVFNVI